MLIHSKDIKPQLSSILRKLMDDVLLQSSNNRPLVFMDEEEYTETSGRSPELSDGEACFTGNDQRFIICLKSLERITHEEELSIAHELGHLWLLFCGFSPERMYGDDESERQEAYKQFLGPLRAIMEHTIFYPFLKSNYQIDLYKVGNKRLSAFIKGDIHKLKSISDTASLILSYIKFGVESDDDYWKEKLSKIYSKPDYAGCKEKAEKLLPIITSNNTPTPKDFINKYRQVLKTLDIKQELWPDFAS